MTERNITKKDIDILLSGEIKIITFPSKTDINAVIVLGFVETKAIAIIKNNKTNILITVRGMRDNEKKLFQKEAQNE